MEGTKSNSIELKKMNRKQIFRYLYGKEAQSKQDIAYALHMSVPTVAKNVRELENSGLVLDVGMFESTGGRKAQAFVFNPKAKFALGLDVTRNHVGIVLVDLGCNILYKDRIRCAFRHSPEYYKTIGELIEKTVKEYVGDGKKVLGVGIAVPAIVTENRQEMTYSSVLDPRQGVGTLHDFAEFIPYPCMLYNDANAGGFAETWNKGLMEDMIYLSLNNSVGGCIVINGKICYGTNQRGGEVGHMTVVPDGKVCYCGQRGCLDAYCNAKILSDSAGGNLEAFFTRVREGSREHQTIWERYLYYLSIALSNIRMTFDCNLVLGGYVGVYMDEYIERLQEMVVARSAFEKDGSYLKVCSYKTEATAVGAALCYIDPFLRGI